jgi:S1-C subfamily serine protease
MRFLMFVGALLAASSAVVPAAATQEPDQPRPPDSMDFMYRHGPDHFMRMVMNRRARLGMKVNLQARESDSIGAYIDAVTPGGPAASAGIRSGDLITKVGGKSVLQGSVAEAKKGQSLPGLRLIELAAKLGPEDTVAIEYRRGKDRRTVSVVTEDEPDFVVRRGVPGRPFSMRLFRPDGDDPRMEVGDFFERIEVPRPHLEYLSAFPLGDLELAPLNPDLGQYFGTSDGVLVVSAPKEGGLGLKGGDVVVAVDGRKPAGPSHLLRILRSYERGETFKLDILRNRKRETLSASLPADREK